MILMARHGETTYNAARRFQGHSNEAVLTEKGREEARRLADEAGERAQARLAAIPAATSVLSEIVAALVARTA